MGPFLLRQAELGPQLRMDWGGGALMGPGVRQSWEQTPAWRLASCVTLRNSLDLSGLQLPLRQMGDKFSWLVRYLGTE